MPALSGDSAPHQRKRRQARQQPLAVAGARQALVVAVDVGLVVFGADGAAGPLR